MNLEMPQESSILWTLRFRRSLRRPSLGCCSRILFCLYAVGLVYAWGFQGLSEFNEVSWSLLLSLRALRPKRFVQRDS